MNNVDGHKRIMKAATSEQWDGKNRIRSWEQDKGLLCGEHREHEISLSAVCACNDGHAEASAEALAAAISGYMHDSAVSHTRELLQPPFSPQAPSFPSLQYPHPLLDPAVSSAGLFVLSFRSMKLHKGRTSSVAPTSCHLVFRPCRHPENSFAPCCLDSPIV